MKDAHLTNQHQTAAEGFAQEILSQFSLSDLFHYVKKNNPAANQPYHNWYHTCTVINSAAAGATFHELSYRSWRHLLVAALYHDFAHSAGKHPDRENIAFATMALKKTMFVLPSGIDVEEVVDYIKITEYPFIHQPHSIEQQILRDADLTQSLSPGWYDMTILGLQKELATAGKVLTTQEMLKGQITFMRDARFYSTWGSEVVRPKLTEMAVDLQYINITDLPPGISAV